MHEHTIHAFETELTELTNRINEMGALAQAMVSDSMEALKTSDTDIAQNVRQRDNELDEIQQSIEERAVMIIARRQPMATDLRHVMSAIRVAADLERIGDLAKNTAKRVEAISHDAIYPKQLIVSLERISMMVVEQIKDVLESYLDHDDVKAQKVWLADDAIDQLYTGLFREMLTYMMEDPRTITACTHLMFCAKNIERIGDHATNIAESVNYLVKGKTAFMDSRPKADKSSYTRQIEEKRS